MDAGGRPDDDQRLVVYSEEAALDLADIHTHTNRNWGWQQAEDYVDLLKAEAKAASERPEQGRSIKNRPGHFLVLVKWPGARAGHRIIYKKIPVGIYVLRILHTAMDLPLHLGQDES